MKKLLLLATGGTIASRASDHGLRPALSAADLCAALGREADTIEVSDLLALHEHYPRALADDCTENRSTSHEL